MLIALNGNKGAGKDTFASFLVKNYNFIRIGFADKLKESAAALFEIDPEQWDEYKNDDSILVAILKTNPDGFRDEDEAISEMTARKFLQLYGTESHRTVFYDDFWIDAAIPDNVEEYNEWANGRDVVITDARFPNELKRVRELGGIVVRIERPELETNDSHVSETPPPPELIDHVVSNGGDLLDLEIMADFLIARLTNQEEKQLNQSR